MDEMEMEELKSELLELGRNKKFASLRSKLITLNPADIAEIFEDLVDDEEISNDEVSVLFRLLPKDIAADSFVEMNSDLQEVIISGLSDKDLRAFIDEMYLDDAVDVIEEMPANVVSRILRNVDAETRKNINTLLNYPEDSAGSIMTIEYVTLKPQMTVQQAFAHIRSAGVDKETIYICYVTEQKKLVGIVSVKDLLLANYEDKIRDIMETNFITVNTLDDKEDVANTLKKYNFTALPVVDQDERLVGIVTIDDAVDVLEEEATEDIEKMAAILPSEHEYLRSGVFEIWKQRIPWLLLLMVSATFTGMIIGHFENALAAQVVLTAFIPMLMDTGGNAGSQASVSIIRALSLDELSFSDLPKTVWKESRVSLLIGVTLAVTNFGKLMIVDQVTPTVAAVVCLTLVVTVFVAKLVGCSLPMFAKKLGFDPAVMASPFITTIVDALSLLIYFEFATLILGIA